MRRLIRVFVVETFALYVASGAAYGIVFEKGLESLFLAGLALSATTLIVKPIINLLLLPLNLITFNLFKWVSSAIALYLVTSIVPSFKIIAFNFGGFTTGLFDLPSINLTATPAFIGFSFIIALVTGFIYWLVKTE